MEIIDFIVLVVLAAIAVVFCFLPTTVQQWFAAHLSFGHFGIRTIKRRHDQTDTLGNFILFLCLVFCCLYWKIPQYFLLLYTILFGISFLILMSQTYRISQTYSKKKQISLILAIFTMCAIAYCSAIGLLNGHQIMKDLPVFLQSLQKNETSSFFYYVRHYEWVSVILSGLVMFYTFYLVCAQFKYMRLENSFKADNMIFFWIKVIFVSILSIGLGYGGYRIIALAYYL